MNKLSFSILYSALLFTSASEAAIIEMFQVAPGGKIRVVVERAAEPGGITTLTDGGSGDNDKKQDGIVTFNLPFDDVTRKQVTILDPSTKTSPIIYEKLYTMSPHAPQKHYILPIIEPISELSGFIYQIDFSLLQESYPLLIGSKYAFVSGSNDQFAGITIYDATGLDAASMDALTDDIVSTLPLYQGQAEIISTFSTVMTVPEPNSIALALSGIAFMLLTMMRVKQKRLQKNEGTSREYVV